MTVDDGEDATRPARPSPAGMATAALTPPEPLRLFPAVQRLFRLIALLLLTLWVPATLHCGFEAAGLGGMFACDDEHHSGTTSRDACDVVENGWFKLANHPTSLPAPILCPDLFCFVTPPPVLLTPPLVGVTEAEAAPPDIARHWQFAFRATLSPRAPSLAS